MNREYPGDVRDSFDRLVQMEVDGIVSVAPWETGGATPCGLFQVAPDGNRRAFPKGAMTCTPADLDAGDVS